MNRTKALRKKRINWYWAIPSWSSESVPIWYYDNLHQYSKNKIHCSCPMCRNKTRNRGAAAFYGGTNNWSISDKRKLDTLKFDFFNEK